MHVHRQQHEAQQVTLTQNKAACRWMLSSSSAWVAHTWQHEHEVQCGQDCRQKLADLAEIVCHLCVGLADAVVALPSSRPDQVQQLGSCAVGCCHQLLLQGRAADAIQASAYLVCADLTAAGIMQNVGATISCCIRDMQIAQHQLVHTMSVPLTEVSRRCHSSRSHA